MNGSEDHDILLRIERDVKHLKETILKCNENFERLRHDVDFHDRLLNKMKGATAATIVFVTIFGTVLLYLLFK